MKDFPQIYLWLHILPPKKTCRSSPDSKRDLGIPFCKIEQNLNYEVAPPLWKTLISISANIAYTTYKAYKYLLTILDFIEINLLSFIREGAKKIVKLFGQKVKFEGGGGDLGRSPKFYQFLLAPLVEETSIPLERKSKIWIGKSEDSYLGGPKLPET